MENVLELNHVYKSFGKKEILKDITFSLQRDEIVGFLGPNGAGKSTVMKCIATVYFATEGTISIMGHDVIKDHAQAMKHLGINIENPTLYPYMNGYDHLKLIGGYKGVSKQRIEEMAEFSGLKDSLNEPTKQYSLGMKQRLALSLALLNKPEVLILDEPTNGLDPDAVFELRKQIQQIRKDGSSVLISSHTLGEIEKIADRSIFIKKGEIIQQAYTKDIIDQIQSYTFFVDDVNKALSVLKCSSNVMVQSHIDNRIVCEFIQEKDFSLVLELLAKEVSILRIERNHMDLESYYKKIYGGLND